MAEAIAALSLVSNVIQIISFTADLVSQAKQLVNSTSGVLPKNEWIEHAARQNKELAAELDIQASKFSPKTKADAAVSELARRCTAESSHLLELLTSLKLQQKPDGTVSKWETGKILLKSLRKSGGVEASSQRLERLEIQLCAVLVQRIHYSQVAEFQSLRDCTQRSEERAVKVITQNSNRILQSLEESRKAQQAMQKRLDEIKELLEYSGDRSRVDNFLASLMFQEMDHRRSAIAERSHGTFEWMLNDTGKSFGMWVLTDEPLFWVCGEPGSGKSVLMKTLRQHDRTRDLVERSPFGKAAEVAIVDYYFWLASNSPLQKNVIDMLRTIIHQVVASYPGLLKKLPADIQQRRFSTSWSRKDLLRLLHLITTHIKVVLFVDGLDECEGSQVKLAELADDIVALASSSNIRACVSSRPSNIFEQRLGSLPFQIRLQQLTQMDRFYFVRNVLASNQNLFPPKIWTHVEASLLEDRQISPLQTMHIHKELKAYKVIKLLVLSDESNFLWLDLILDAVCERIANGAGIEEIEQRVYDMPEKLEDYYEKSILDRINDTYFHETAMALKLYTICRGTNLTTVSLFWSLYDSLANNGTFHWEAGADFNFGFVDCSETALLAMVNATKRWLNGCCRGLLHVCCVDPDALSTGYPFGLRIHPNHRTVDDFLCGPRVQQILNKRVPKRFLENTIVEDIAISYLKILPKGSPLKDVHLLDIYVQCTGFLRERSGRVPESFIAAFRGYTQVFCVKTLIELSNNILSRGWFHLTSGLLWVGEDSLVAQLFSCAPRRTVVALTESSTWKIVSLLCIVCIKGPFESTSVAFVKFLLSYNADPNGRVNPVCKATVWHELLRLSVRKLLDEIQHEPKDWLQYMRDVCVAFIKHGADIASPICIAGHDCRWPASEQVPGQKKKRSNSGTDFINIRPILDKFFAGDDQILLNSLLEHYSKPEVQQNIHRARLERYESCKRALVLRGEYPLSDGDDDSDDDSDNGDVNDDSDNDEDDGDDDGE